jgi:hypothetical protein
MLPTRNAKQVAETLDLALREAAATAENVTKDLVTGSTYVGNKLGFAADRHATGMETLALSIDKARVELRDVSQDWTDSLRLVAGGFLIAVAIEGIWRWLDRRGE